MQSPHATAAVAAAQPSASPGAAVRTPRRLRSRGKTHQRRPQTVRRFFAFQQQQCNCIKTSSPTLRESTFVKSNTPQSLSSPPSPRIWEARLRQEVVPTQVGIASKDSKTTRRLDIGLWRCVISFAVGAVCLMVVDGGVGVGR